MATTEYFNETIVDQDNRTSMSLEVGRSSFYAGCDVASGKGRDSIYLTVDGKTVIMPYDVAQRFAEAVQAVGQYHQMI
jgi:hypothetical protein